MCHWIIMGIKSNTNSTGTLKYPLFFWVYDGNRYFNRCYLDVNFVYVVVYKDTNLCSSTIYRTHTHIYMYILTHNGQEGCSVFNNKSVFNGSHIYWLGLQWLFYPFYSSVFCYFSTLNLHHWPKQAN